MLYVFLAYKLKEALEANREARRKSQQHKAAIAFEIDLSTAASPPSVVPVAMVVAPRIAKTVSNSNINEVRRSRESEENMAPSSSHHHAAVVGKSRNDSSPSILSSSSSSSSSAKGGSEVDLSLGSVRSSNKNRKGWGPPIVPGDAVGGMQIAKGVVRYSEYASRAVADRVDQMFNPDSGNDADGGNRKSIDKSDDGSISFNGNDYNNNDSSYDGYSNNNIHQQDSNDDHSQKDASVPDDLTNDEGEGQLLVMRRLESKRNSQLQARQQAKEIFKKLREKKRHESEVKKPPSAGIAVDDDDDNDCSDSDDENDSDDDNYCSDSGDENDNNDDGYEYDDEYNNDDNGHDDKV